jgi:hypothetical protein
MDANPYESPVTPIPRLAPPMLKCQSCGGDTEHGFVIANAGIGFVPVENVTKAIVSVEAIAKGGAWWAILPAAKWFKATLCRSCHFLLVDYGERLSHSEAQELARNHPQSKAAPRS